MKKINVLSVLKRFDLVVVFVIIFIILIPVSKNLCKTIDNHLFDSQSLLLWDFLKDLNVVPIKDTFHPHGIFFYFITNNQLAYFVYLLIGPAIFTLIYYFFKRLYSKDNFITLLLFIMFFILITSITQVRTGNRYGLLIFSSLISALMFSNRYKFQNKIFLVGIINGLIVSMETGIGIYVVVSQIIFFSFYHLFIFTNKKEKIINPALSLRNYAAGLAIGLIPLFIFIRNNQMISEFIKFIKDASFFSEYAKTPIDIFQRGPLIILIISIALMTHFINSFLAESKKRIDLYTVTIFSFTPAFLLILHKYMLRQMHPTMFMFSLVALFVILSPIYKKYYRIGRKRIYFIFILATILLSFAYSLRVSINLTSYGNNFIQGLREIREKDLLSSNMCVLEDFNPSVMNLNNSYLEVVDYLENNFKGRGVISFPYDPVFYILLKQTPPPYPNIWEASPISTQEQNISYMQDKPVEIVIYNLRPANVDGIPDYLRAARQLKYIFRHYEPLEYIEPFILMKLKNNRGYLLNDGEIDKKYDDFVEHVLNLDFGSIFKTEGLYKSSRLINESEEIIEAENFEGINKILKENKINSENLFILVKYKPVKGKKVYIDLTNEFGKTTQIFFQGCISNYCLINIENIPLFYLPSDLTSILGIETVESIVLVKKIKDSSYYW